MEQPGDMAFGSPLFKEWPKIHRLNREIVVTEKIDGTNGIIYISEDEQTFLVGSRTRWILPDNDNYGFAKWAYEHKDELMKLGKGYHYGEWWGNGIQRGYGLPKDLHYFSLFNTKRWSDNPDRPKCCEVVPVLYAGNFSELAITGCLDDLKLNGSKVVPYLNPEGIVVFHSHSGQMFKVTLENDEKPKGKINEPQS